MVLGLLCGGFIFYKVYKHFKQSNLEELDRLTPEKQLRKALVFEIITISVSFGLGFFDFITDALALHEVQASTEIPSTLVLLYFGLVIFVSVFFAIVIYSTIKSLMIVAKEFKQGLVDITSDKMNNKVAPKGDVEENKVETKYERSFTQLAQKGNTTQQYTKIQRAIGGEKMSLLMALCEDTPMTIFNSLLIFYYNITSKTIFVSFVINALMMGYKLSEIERLWLNMQLKGKLDKMCEAVRISRGATHITDQEEIYEKLVDVGRTLAMN